MRLRARWIKGHKGFAKRELKKIHIESQIDTKRVAEEALKIIRDTINQKSRKPTGHLASTFDIDKIKGGYGVGDIPTLNKEAKYWRHINYGSIAIGANWQHYLPKGMWVDGRWEEHKAGYAGIMPKTPIEPMNYIESTINKMDLAISKILAR